MPIVPNRNKSIFNFQCYKSYVTDLIQSQQKTRGLKAAIASVIKCQAAYVSQVLGGDNHFSLEQADRLNHFLAHNSEEGFFFLLLVQRARAGTPSLRQNLDKQLAKIRVEQKKLHAKIHPVDGELDDALVSQYYSDWGYAAIHMILTIPTCQEPNKICDALGLSLHSVANILNFLVQAGLASKSGTTFSTTKKSLHLPGDHHMIGCHHRNWRGKMLAHFDSNRLSHSDNSIHYSSVKSFNKEDLPIIRSILTEAILKVKQTVKETKAEDELYSFCLDFFSLTK